MREPSPTGSRKAMSGGKPSGARWAQAGANIPWTARWPGKPGGGEHLGNQCKLFPFFEYTHVYDTHVNISHTSKSDYYVPPRTSLVVVVVVVGGVGVVVV